MKVVQAKVIHYSGGISLKGRRMLPGWPACVSGVTAYNIRAEMRQTQKWEDVTCRKCLRLMLKAIQ